MRIWFRVYVKTCRVLCSWNILHMLRLMYMFECGVICFVCLIFGKVGSVHAENIVSVSVFTSAQVSVRLFGWFRCRCLFLVVWHIVSCLVSCTGLYPVVAWLLHRTFSLIAWLLHRNFFISCLALAQYFFH